MRSLALAAALSLASVAVAEERYVPVAAATELHIANPSPRRAHVVLELLGRETVRLDVEPGAAIRWTPPAREGVVRIDGDATLHVTAVSERGGARVSLPVVAARDTAEEAELPRRGAWRSGVLAVNPGEATAFVTVDGVLHAIEGRRALRVDHASAVRAHAPLLLFACEMNDASGARVFTPIAQAMTRKRRAVRSGTPSSRQMVSIVPSKDNTLFESETGALSNGAGPHLFAGTTRFGGKRRALVAFDVAGQIPPGSRITRVSLTMRVSQTISGDVPATLHRVTANWGEGSSNAGGSRDGAGEPAAPGDATWLHTFFPNSRWSNAGGDFVPAADATAPVGTQSGTWESPAMIARVQQWLDQPATNFGWIVIATETSAGSAKRFDSREASAATRPSLTIEFQR